MRVFDFLLDVIFPRFCVACRREGSWLCNGCSFGAETLALVCFHCERRSPDGATCGLCRGKTRIGRSVAPLTYKNQNVRELIHLLKFDGVKELAEFFAGAIIERVRRERVPVPQTAWLIPIPLHRKRERERGFNQADLIALCIGERLGLAVRKDIIIRNIYKPPQSEIKDKTERLKNVEGVFKAAGAIPKGTAIILVDDVATTGATIEAAAKTLRRAGAKEIWSFVAAR